MTEFIELLTEFIGLLSEFIELSMTEFIGFSIKMKVLLCFPK